MAAGNQYGSYHEWSDAETLKLAQMFFSTPRPSNEEIARALGRTPGAIANYLSRSGMSDPKAKLRRCLPCSRVFFSSHFGERICGFRKRSEWMRCA